ncbi:MAG: lycopene cyclase domain-containing protein [Saprospirales bacterium]|nr:MAG: lycopene cyclase domain-containing protein [Saprospirales bacterium]
MLLFGYQNFDYVHDVPLVTQLKSLETSWLYAWVHIFVFLPVFLLSFDKKVFYASRWKQLFPAIILVAIPFLIWDVFFTAAGVWEFNEKYISGIRVFGLPWEELMFFVTVPFACLFLYDCLNAYFPSNRIILWEQSATILLSLSLIVFGLIFYDRIYTASACLIALLSLIWVRYKGETAFLSNFYRAFLVVLIPFFFTDGILTGGFTEEPIVLYNTEHFSGYRVVSIPIEDYIYGFALLLQANYLYVRFRR